MTGAALPAFLRRAALIAALASAAPAAAQACNPFEFLFGGCRPQPSLSGEPVYTYERVDRPRVEARKRATKPRTHSVEHSDSGVSGKQRAMAATSDAPMGSLALFARDPTLRPGDIVVTNDGFRVYGSRGKAAFAPLAKKDGLLAAMEQASRRAPANATPAPAPPPAATARTWIGARKQASLAGHGG